MITIQQDTSDTSGIEMLANKYGPIDIKVDWDAIDSDVDKLKEKAKNPLSKFDKQNILVVKKRIEDLINKSNDDMHISLNWKLENFVLRSNPIQLDSIPEYSIEMIDYVSISEGQLVRVSYYEMLKAMAFDMMYRDINVGTTLKEIDTKLEEVGITGVYPVAELLKHCQDDAFMLSKQLRVGSSPYKEQDTHKIIDYFSRQHFDGKYYRQAVDYSARYAYTVISKGIMNKLGRSGEECRLISITDSGIYFATNCDEDKLHNLLGESVVVRAFGRRFEVKPKIIFF